MALSSLLALCGTGLVIKMESEKATLEVVQFLDKNSGKNNEC